MTTMNWIDYTLAVLITVPILATLVLGAFLAKSGKHSMGKPTIQPFFFFTGKFFLFMVWALFAFIALFPQYRHLVPLVIQNEIPDVQKLLAAVFLIPANLIIVPAYLSMGLITHIGLPEGKHELRTSGIYHYSRNPMYASFIFLNTSAFLFLPSILLLVIMIYGMVVHHFIILGEEKYLEGEFKDQYLDYKASVPRYL
jgi:protein-S-isoprenylcysteine O-methyltransferase Ste14